MKLFSSEHEFGYSWEQVTAANWQKYPNEQCSHVVAVDVLRRELDPKTGVLTTERLITCKQAIPSWLQMIVGGANCSYVREVSQVDPVHKTLVMRSCNLTMCNLLRVYETCVYSPLGSSATRFHQTAEITAYASWKRMCDKIEDWSVERFGQNAVRGKLGFESVLKLFDEHVVQQGGKLIDEVADKTSNVLTEVSDKTSSVLSELSTELSIFTK